MTATPALTVVIPAYDRADTIERAVRSVLRQEGCPDFEVIVVDDGSTDATPEVLASIEDPRLRVRRQDNAGRGAARNAGAHEASGAVVTFLDSDDEALPGWLAEIASRLDPPDIPVVRLGVLRARPDGSTELIPGAPLRPDHPFPTGACQGGSFALTTELFHAVGGFDPALEFAENTDLLVRLALASRRDGWDAAWTATAGVLWHQEALGSRRDRYAGAPAHAAAVMLHRYRTELRREPRIRRDYLAVQGTGELRAGRRGRAAIAFARAWWARPFSLLGPARLASVVLPARWRARLRPLH
jgi:glycosyltransferase involved in cell wall biosynthesis